MSLGLFDPGQDDRIRAALRTSLRKREMAHVAEVTGYTERELRSIMQSTEPLTLTHRGALASRLAD